MKRLLMILFSLMMFGMVMTPLAQTLEMHAAIPQPFTWLCAVLFMIGRSMSYKGAKRNFMTGVVTMAVTVEIWNEYIAENIYKNNEFLQYAWNADDKVLVGKVVHIPQSGAASNVVKNRSSLPATVTKRQDTDVTYALDEYTTDPRLISNAEECELSYDKLNSVMTDDMGALRQTVADNMLINWAPATNIIRTTGGANAVQVAVPYLPSQIGARYSCHHEDVEAAMTFLNAQDIPMEDRYALLSARMYSQLIKSLSATQYTDFSRAYDPKTGVMGELHSFKIMQRSTVLVYNNAATPVVKAYGASGAATDNDASIFWQKNALERALGEVQTFEQEKAPQYYGTVMSFLLRMGGRIRRADEKGIVALVQGVPA